MNHHGRSFTRSRGNEGKHPAEEPLDEAAGRRGGEPADGTEPLTRSRVAEELGTSIASVRRLEGKTLHPTKGAGSVHLFDPAGVAAVVAQRTASSEVKLRRSAEGDLAAEAFKQFNRGLDIRAVVIELRQPPAFIHELHRQWRAAGGLWIPSALLAVVRKSINARYLAEEAIRIGAPQDLVDAIEHALDDLDDARERHWDSVDQIAELRREKRALRDDLRESRAQLADWAEWAGAPAGACGEPPEGNPQGSAPTVP